MVADADIVEAKVAQDILGKLDHVQLLRGDGLAVGDPGAEAGHLGFVGGRQPEPGRERADIGFGEAGLLEGCADLELLRGAGTGPKVPDIAGVFAVGEDSHTFNFGQRGKLGEQLVFTEIAAVFGVGEVAGIVKFAGAEDAHRKPELAGEGHRLLKFTAGQAGRISDRSEGLIPQHLVRHTGEEGRVYAARVGHKAGTVRAQEAAQSFVLFRYHRNRIASRGKDVEGRQGVTLLESPWPHIAERWRMGEDQRDPAIWALGQNANPGLTVWKNVVA